MQPDLILTPFGENATPGTIEPIPETRSPGDIPQKANWDEGFPLVTMTPLAAGGLPPQGQDFNGIFKAISEQCVFTGGGGQYRWTAAYVARNGGYPKGAVLQADDGLSSYVSLIDDNADNFNTTPASIGVSWALYSGSGIAPSQATETAAGVAEIATQPEVASGVDDARIVTPRKLRGALATQAEAEDGTDTSKWMSPLRVVQSIIRQFTIGQRLTANGYQKFPGGLIVQWGAGTTASNGTLLVTMPIAFTTTPKSIVATVATAAANNVCVAINVLSTGSFRAYTTAGPAGSPGVASPLSFNWISIGY